MTITISQQALNDLFQETVERSQHPDPDDPLDVMYKYPQLVGQGYWRVIQLRQGIELEIGVTGVQLNQTDSGLEVLLETTSSLPLAIITSSYGRTFVANITNARLALPEGKSFRQENLTGGIAVVSVTPQGNNDIRVTAIIV